jgi:hypothetical protein
LKQILKHRKRILKKEENLPVFSLRNKQWIVTCCEGIFRVLEIRPCVFLYLTPFLFSGGPVRSQAGCHVSFVRSGPERLTT